MNIRIHHTLSFTLLAFLVGSTANAQTYWAKDLGGPGNDQVTDVKTDSAGNIFATGEFSGSIVFGGVTHVSTAGIDMFLTKLSPTGQVLWFVQGGGPGIDRGIKLAVRNGHVAVVGAFMQTATFQGQSLTSAGGPDIFLAVHDAATGNLQWIVGGGGSLASDRPYGVSIAGSGNVTMVGEFSGSATIGGNLLTSMIDSQTSLPSVDVFIATYSPAGIPLWTRQGAAKHTDRAIDVVNDATDNLYVTGQFSDTIQFVSTHPNVMYNATFLLKLDALGNEIWFRRVGGAVYDEVRDMQWTSANDLLIVGDLQGTMIFLDSVPDLISSVAPYAYYLLRVNSDGQLSSDTVVTSANQVSGRAIDERNGIITVLGQFDCQFTSMVDSAHAGLWMATGMEDLFIVRHSLDSLYVIKDAQQFGGRQEKLAGQVTTLNDGSPVFCGSFEDMIVFPCQNVFTADIASFGAPYGLSAPNTGGYCGDAYYGSFAADTSKGLKDGFIARGFVIGRSPYDWWDRSGTNCSFLPRSLCLGPGEMAQYCPDTIEFCGPDLIGIDPQFSFTIDDQDFFVGPELDFLWSTGDTTDSLLVATTGMYSVTCTSVNGCLQWTDSVYVIIHPIPPQPLLSDDVIVETDSPVPYHIPICDPTEVWLWCSNVDTTTTFHWIGPGGMPVANDSLLVDTSGTYYFSMQSAFGCSSSNHLMVDDHPSLPIPNVTVSIQISYPQDTDHNDTLDLCPQISRYVNVIPTWYLNGTPYTFPYTNPPDMYFGFVMNGDTMISGQATFSIGYQQYVPGWYADSASVFILNKPCGTDTLFLPTVAVDSIYVRLFPSVYIDVGLAGPSLICPSDTALLVATCANCDEITWQGNGIINITGDSAYVGGGSYSAYGSVVDTNGCSFSDYDTLHVSYPGVPELDVFPPDGIICPDSIAVIYTHALGSYTWFGPNGEIAINNDSIFVSIPGEYYLALVDPNGCYLISDPILVTGYATPFLNVTPDGVLCIGEDPVLLQVVTTGYSSLAWAAPLSGNSLTQLVGQPGTYSCSVQACGIITQLSTEIIAGSAVAEVLDPGPFIMCPGDTLQLNAAGGQAVYIWNPGQVFGDSLLVTHGGSYSLTVLDGNGCTDTSDIVMVAEHDLGGPLTITDQTVCIGTPVTLEETATGNFSWYADSALTVLLGTGPILDLGTPMDSSIVHLVRSDSVCVGLSVSVHVDVVDPPSSILLSSPGPLCAGDSTMLIASTVAPFNTVWATPAGTGFGDTLMIGPATQADSGWYVVTAVSSGCIGQADSLLLPVVEPAIIDLGPDTAICPGTSLVFAVPPGFADPIWQQTITAMSYTADQTGTVELQATDMNGCSAHDTVAIMLLIPDEPAGANDLSICFGQDAVLVATGSGLLSWYADPDLQGLMGTGDSLSIISPADSLTVYLVQDQFGCEGQPLVIGVNVVPTPVDIDLTGPDPFCVGESALITASGPPGLEGNWTTPSGPYTGTTLSFTSVLSNDEGWYTMVPSVAGCIGAPDSIYMTALVPVPIDLGGDTTFCIGGQFILVMPSGFTSPMWSTGATGTSIIIQTGGTYSVEATDVNGCPSSDIILVDAVDCPSIVPNVFTPNGDGVNDGFSLGAIGAVRGELVVYDRWGVLVHEGDLMLKAWNATDDKSGEPVQEGVYYYVLHLVDSTGSAKELSGYFTVMR